MKNWYKTAVIYSLDVEAYRDADGDGTGDFEGIKKSLPYLSSLGVNCVWLLPFFDTPNKDNGYDVKDYFTIDKRFGNLGTFVEFMDIAKQYNIRILIDLVVNHTSNEHPWFKEALKGPGNEYYNYYIWTKEKPKDYEPKLIFGDQQSGNWEYVEELDSYYFHTFYKFQPDLNLANPKVRDEIKRIMHFWTQLGISGFRMDAVTHMISKKHESQDFDKSPHHILKEFRGFLELHAPDCILLAEADVKPEAYEKFFSGNDEMHMLFNFYANNYLFYSLAIDKAAPLIKAFKAIPQANGTAQYANFIRNHDELDLERLSDDEMQKVLERFAPDEDMRIFGRGIRRRFNPMVKGDRKLLEFSYSLLLSLPGTPVLRYGQEIGMGEDLSLPGRDAVRTVMQWSNQQHAGFSIAPSEKLARPVIEHGPFNFKEINVNKQIKDKNSLVNWMSLAITARTRCPEFGTGAYEFLDYDDDEVMIHLCRIDESVAVAIHNFGNEKKKVRLNIDENLKESLIDIFGNEPYPDLDPQNNEVEINGKGYRWFRTGF